MENTLECSIKLCYNIEGIINNELSFEQGSKLYVFPCNRWLARDEDDKEIVRELLPEKIIKETIRKDGEVEKKEVKVKDKLQSEWRNPSLTPMDISLHFDQDPSRTTAHWIWSRLFFCVSIQIILKLVLRDVLCTCNSSTKVNLNLIHIEQCLYVVMLILQWRYTPSMWKQATSSEEEQMPTSSSTFTENLATRGKEN